MNGYYLSRQRRLLRDFDGMVKRVQRVFIARFGREQANAMLAEARAQYEALIPKLPYIGGRQPFTQFIIFTAWFLAIYRTMLRHSHSLEETGRLIYELGQVVVQGHPAILSRLVGQMNFSRRYLGKVRQRAAESHQRQYPGDYVFNFVEGDGETFDYGVDYLECGSCKFLAAQGAPELAPFLCPGDILYSQALGWGLRRTLTLAGGDAKCDFRFKRGGRTHVAVHEALQALVGEAGYVRGRGAAEGAR